VPVLTDPFAASDALHARVRAMIAAFERGEAMPEPFGDLALALARFQEAHVPGYARLCAARRVDLAAVVDAGAAPAVPADAFKAAHVFAFAEDEARAVFRTSGTSGAGLASRGTHALRTLATYDAAALAYGRRMLARGLPAHAPVLVVGPSAAEAPDSSLAHMCALFVAGLVGPDVGRGFFIGGGALDLGALRARVAGLDLGTPAVVLATSFALVHLIDALGGTRLPLPAGSRVMQTGGFKGRSREVSPAELRRAIAHAFAVDPRAIVGEYGMTELSSQFWEATAVDDRAPPGVYFEPPWARIVPVDGDTLAPVAPGEVGIARIEDLANVDSAWAVLTQDRVRRVPGGGFELLGRAPGAPPRGCSIALDEMLSASR
jgi:hypothetical protein